MTDVLSTLAGIIWIAFAARLLNRAHARYVEWLGSAPRYVGRQVIRLWADTSKFEEALSLSRAQVRRAYYADAFDRALLEHLRILGERLLVSFNEAADRIASSFGCEEQIPAKAQTSEEIEAAIAHTRTELPEWSVDASRPGDEAEVAYVLDRCWRCTAEVPREDELGLCGRCKRELADL